VVGKYHVTFFLPGVIVLKFLGSVRKYNFYENEKYGTFAIYKNNKPIAYPTTIEQVLLKMEQVGKSRK